MTRDPDLFEEPRLGLSLRKPSAWRFLPPAWSPVQQLKNADPGGDETEWIRRANLPFCCAMGHHDSARHAYPTLQVTARPVVVRTGADAATMLELARAQLAANYPDLVVESARADLEIAGVRANAIRGRFTLLTLQDEVEVPIGVRARSIMIFSPHATFTVGLSGSDDPAYYDEAEFDAILASLRLRLRHATVHSLGKRP